MNIKHVKNSNEKIANSPKINFTICRSDKIFVRENSVSIHQKFFGGKKISIDQKKMKIK